jgi:hypothetical protein
MFLSVVSFVLGTLTVADNSDTPPVWKRANATMVSLCQPAVTHRENGDNFPDPALSRSEFKAEFKALMRCIPRSTGLKRAYLYTEAIAALNNVVRGNDDSSETSQARQKEKELIKLTRPLARPDHDLIDILQSFDDQML